MCRQFRIVGRVQGVFFRDGTRSEAKRLGLAGYAKNLANGDVDVGLCGSAADMEEMIRWLKLGSPMAIVQHVTEEPVACSKPVGFITA